MCHFSVPGLPKIVDASVQTWPPQDAHLVLASLPTPFISVAALPGLTLHAQPPPSLCAKHPGVLCAEITFLGSKAGSGLLEPTNPSPCHLSLYLLPDKQDLSGVWGIASLDT